MRVLGPLSKLAEFGWGRLIFSVSADIQILGVSGESKSEIRVGRRCRCRCVYSAVRAPDYGALYPAFAGHRCDDGPVYSWRLLYLV